MRRICIVVLFTIISGILFQIIFHPALVYNLLLCGLAIILSFWKRWFLYVLIAWLSAINTSLHAPMRFSDVERDVVFSGVVIGEEPREHYVKLLVAIDGVEVDNKRIDYRNRVEFYTREQGTFLGNRLFIKGRITHAKYPNRPNILTGDVIKIDRECSPWGLLNLMRSYIHRLLKRLLNNEYYDVGMGLVLGGSGRITRDLRDLFSRAGVLHILAVSGLHVGFVCIFVGTLLFFAPISVRIKFLIIMLILILYAGITGFRPSVCRATVMAFLFGLSLMLQRNVEGIHIVNITAIIFLLIHPLILFDVGAQLSFAAVYGIFFLYPLLNNHLIRKVKRRLYKYILAPMAVSFSAQLFVSPLLIYYFHRLPTLAVISNLIIVPIASIVIFLLFLCIITGTFSFMLAEIMSIPVNLLLTSLVTIAKLFARTPCSAITLYISPLILLSSYLLASQRLRKIAILLILIMTFFYSLASFSDSIVVRTSVVGTLVSMPHGEHLFISTRRSPKYSAPFLAHQNIEELDYLIAPSRYYSPKRGFYETPDRLHRKQVRVGELIIDLSESITLLYGEKRFVLDNEYIHAPRNDNLLCVITDGHTTYRFRTLLYGSIVDRILVDLKTVFYRLRCLL